jgi:hypothetical protein
MPDGSLSAAKFRTFQWPIAEAPGGLRIFACQHKTRDTVWIPQLMRHANGARHLRQVLVVSPDPGKDARHLGRLTDREATPQADGSFVVASGPDRADFVFLPRDLLAQRYPGISLAGLPERGGAGLVIATTDIGAAAKAVGAAGARGGDAICVAPANANGALLTFVQG